MFFYNGLSCPHCLTPFTEEDDVVACPVCGAPHHRDCWKENGGCACAHAHGTEEQWSREKAAQHTAAQEHTSQNDRVNCPHCQADNSPFAERCSHCGAVLTPKEWGSQTPPRTAPTQNFHEYTPFHTMHMPCGGVSPEADLEGETAKDLAMVVRTNVPYYLPRFERIARSGKKLSWNWAAFLLTPYWLLFRKQYLAGILVLLAEIFNTVVVNVLAYTCFPTVMTKANKADMINEMLLLVQIDARAEMAMYIISLLSLVILCIRLGVAIFGNRLYMKHCLRTIRRTREGYPEAYHAQLSLVGGTSLAFVAMGFLCYQILPVFILNLIL